MEELIAHLVHPFLTHPTELQLNIIEGEASLLIELQVHPEDRENLPKEKIFSIQHVISLASGNKKPMLEVVEQFQDDPYSSEEVSDTETSESAVDDVEKDTDEESKEGASESSSEDSDEDAEEDTSRESTES